MSTDPAQHLHAPAAPRRSSGARARLLTALWALVALPAALALLAYGGSVLRRFLVLHGPRDGALLVEVFTTPMGLMAIGAIATAALLLASVVATGMFSSAGLLVCGVLGLGTLLMTALPPVPIEFLLVAFRPGTMYMMMLEGIIYGTPLVLPALLGGLGAAVMLARRDPKTPLAAMLLGLVLVPLGLAAATFLLFRAHAGGVYEAVPTFKASADPVIAVLAVLGAVLLWLSAAATRWSPYALALPAVVLLLASVLLRLSHLLPLPSILWTSPSGQLIVMFLDSGGGVAAAVIMLAHTVVLPIVRIRSRRRSVPSSTATAPASGNADATAPGIPHGAEVTSRSTSETEE